MRLFSSGASHLAHIARGALPNIAPPSSFWLLPSMDQSFIAVASVIACRHGNAAGFDWRSAAYAPPDPSPSPACGRRCPAGADEGARSEEHTSELQSLMRNSYAVFCLKKKTNRKIQYNWPTPMK